MIPQVLKSDLNSQIRSFTIFHAYFEFAGRTRSGIRQISMGPKIVKLQREKHPVTFAFYYDCRSKFGYPFITFLMN